jgi:serine/threonine-protein kinase
MAPEQVEGKDADARSDIFSFGAMLYEMTTGRRAFQGKSRISVMAAILEQDPAPASSVVATLPAGVDKVIRRCLAKDPDKRWQCAGDLRSEIEGIAESLAHPAAEVPKVPAAAAAPAARVPRRRVLVDRGLSLTAGIVLTALAVWGVTRLMPAGPPQPVRFAIVPPPAQPLSIFGQDRDIAISPDGTHIVYRAGGAGQGQLAVRAIGRLDAEPLAGITNARAPFLSPDGRWIGFYASPELKKVSITGGPPITLCPTAGFRGASWGPDDVIVFATSDPASGLLSVPAGGGEPKVLTKPDTAKGESDHLFPSILPGGRAVLFTITAPAQVENAQVAVLDLTTGERKILIRGGSHAEYVETGHLVYAAAGTLRAVRFDLQRLEVVSDPVPVVEQVMTVGSGAANFAISRGGTLVFVPGGAGIATGGLRSLVWVNRQGKEEPIKAPTRGYAVPRLSPDGLRVAVEVRDQENDVWILDLRRENLTRLTFDPNVDQLPIWTPDGRRVIFASASAGAANLFWQAADGTGAAERLTTSPNPHLSHSISPDGTRLVLQELSPKTAADLMLLMLDAATGPSTGLGTGPSTAPRRAEPLIQTTFAEWNPEISPDGRWLAYQSAESGQFQVYVRPFPKVNEGRWQVSTAGGTRPAWARNGRELFFLDGNNVLTAVPIQSTATTFSAGNPSKVFDSRYFTGSLYRTYDVSPDGQRFLMIKDTVSTDQTSTSTPASMVVVLNWFEELKARAK